MGDDSDDNENDKPASVKR